MSKLSLAGLLTKTCTHCAIAALLNERARLQKVPDPQSDLAALAELCGELVAGMTLGDNMHILTFQLAMGISFNEGLERALKKVRAANPKPDAPVQNAPTSRAAH